MDDTADFTWKEITMQFPECKIDPTGIENYFWKEFLPNPKFGKDYIKVLSGEYGLQIHLNQKIPSWVNEKEKIMIQKMYSDLSEKVYNEVVDELNKSYKIFESWRAFVTKWENGAWKGNLSNRITFTNQTTNISHYDYYTNYPHSDIVLNSPTSILCAIKKLPKDSLNEKWKSYYKLSENVIYGGKGCCNSITGKTLTECIKNADEIYKIAPELKKLEF